MKQRQNPFRISALNSLKVHEVHVKDQKQLINTFKGATDLRNQLNKNKNLSNTSFNNKTLQTNNNTKQFIVTISDKDKPQQEALMDQVAALDNFKVAVTRQKTKNLIEDIKLRRRQKHIEAYNNFKQDLDDYKQNLLQIYQSLYGDCVQVLNIRESQLQAYFTSQSDDYLLSRQKDVLHEFTGEVESYKQNSREKIQSSREQLQRIKNSRGDIVNDTCEMLRIKLIDIAFVLEDEARQIQNKEKAQISEMESKTYSKYKQMIEDLTTRQEQKNMLMEEKMKTVIKRWRQLKQNFQVTSFEQSIVSQPYINPIKRQNLYKHLIQIQTENHQKKRKSLESLILNQHVDSLRKVNIEKWYEVVKAINDEFDANLDELVKNLMEEHRNSKENHQRLFKQFQQRLRYIQNHTEQEINQMLKEKFVPMVEKNNENSEKMMKDATSYVQLNDQKQNTLLENLFKFFVSISQCNDDFVKDFSVMNQKHELQKAKILDDDEQLIEKLTEQLQSYKKQLRESLHHLKLQEIEKKCFQKIDEIQTAYRKTHELNKELTSKRPTALTNFIQVFENKLAFIFQLYDESKRNELVERNKKDAEKEALGRIELEDKKKLEEEEKQLQLIKKNGGKVPPAPKPKDPKKLAAEIEERKKAILAQIGQKKIQEIKTGSGNTWLVYKSLEDMSKQFYTAPPPQDQTLQNPTPTNHNQDPTKNVPIDKLPQPITNPVGQKITTDKTILSISQISEYLSTLREKIFQNVTSKKQRILSEAASLDEVMMEESLTMLDERLKKHYSLKGQLQSEISIKRSGEITNHKKRYEKYARTVRQKMDLQTERFNFLLEKGLQFLKTHNTNQKKLKQQLSQGKNLSQFQGILGKARENFNKFTQQINQIVAQLNHLSKTQVEILLQKNKDFIKQSRLFKDGGEYSQEQIKWYEEMMNEITEQMKAQQTKRQEKSKDIHEKCDKRKKQLLQKIEKDYHAAIQELSARQGTGKIYGKPKRTAQEKIRLEMNKCEQSQLNINKQIDALIALYQKQQSRGFRCQQRPQTLKWRRDLMTLFTSIERYAKHIQALKKDLKIKPMIRVNYDQNLPQCNIISQEEDKKLQQEELKALGPLGEQKQDKPFLKFVLDIEKIISDESRTIYVGDKAKYLTGNDKLPDFLRKYIAQMKKSAENFRQTCVRQLRESCLRVASFCEQLGELFFGTISQYFIQTNKLNFSRYTKQFTKIQTTHETIKTQNLRLLRPNLSNPKCQQQLHELNDRQLKRHQQFVQEVKSLRQQFKKNHFVNGQSFMNCLINNYEFLIQYSDSLYLYEDFIKVVGDDDEDKPKFSLKKLLIMKQKGIVLDASSQRNLVKKWPGVDFTIINFDDKKFVYKKVEVEDLAAKDNKKGAKKQTKKPANEVPQQSESITTSRQIQTFKTYRQKSIFEEREQCMRLFRASYTQTMGDMYSRIEQTLKQNEMFCKKWKKITEELFIK